MLLKTAQFALERVPFGTVLEMLDVGRKNKNTNYCTLMFYDLRKSGQVNGGENYMARLSVILWYLLNMARVAK